MWKPNIGKIHREMIIDILIIQGRITIANAGIQPSSPLYAHIVLHNIASFSHTPHLYGYARIHRISQTIRQTDYTKIHELDKLFIGDFMHAYSKFILCACACYRMGNWLAHFQRYPS
jgi:hypothetical protein